jgi:hypothetical protein
MESGLLGPNCHVRGVYRQVMWLYSKYSGKGRADVVLQAIDISL